MRLVDMANQQRVTGLVSVMTVWADQCVKGVAGSEGQQVQSVEAVERCLRGPIDL